MPSNNLTVRQHDIRIGGPPAVRWDAENHFARGHSGLDELLDSLARGVERGVAGTGHVVRHHVDAIDRGIA